MAPLADVTVDREAAFFTPSVRLRLLDRLDAAAAHPITLIIAPAGYGKSVALSHWLDRRLTRALRFNMLAEHSTLLGFARGLAAAIAPQSPALPATVATAYQGSSSAPEPGKEMARWMAAHLEDYDGLIAIDDFHRADDPEISRFLAALIAQTKPRVRWAIATRSSLELPVATWLAYGEVGFIIGEAELTFRASEALEVSRCAGKELTERALEGVIAATAGWPVALGLVVRSPEFVATASTLATSTRDMLFQYLAEQVYAELSPAQRDLLHLAAYLPAIDVAVLESAGCRDAAPTLEAIRKRATFLSAESDGVYKCHDLFREFFCRHLQRTDPERANDLQKRAAAALETTGDIAAALRLYGSVQANNDAMRLLRDYGFDLIDHSHGDVVERVVAALPATARASDAVILGLRAQREADSGHFDRAEALFNKAISLAVDSEFAASLSIRLSICVLNEGRPVADILAPFLLTSSVENKAEIHALLAVNHAFHGSSESCAHAMSSAEESLRPVDDNQVRAKVCLRVAIAGLNIAHSRQSVRAAAITALELADASGMLSLGSRACTVLATAALFLDNDSDELMRYAEMAKTRALHSGDRRNLETALLQLACGECQRGDWARLDAVMLDLDAIVYYGSRRAPVIAFINATRSAWRGQTSNAYQLMNSFAESGYGQYNFDKMADTALHSLSAIGANDMCRALELADTAMRAARTIALPHKYAVHQLAVTNFAIGLTYILLGKRAKASKVIELAAASGTDLAPSAKQIAATMAQSSGRTERLLRSLQPLVSLRLGGLGRTLQSYINVAAEAKVFDASLSLTQSELKVMRALDTGLSPKDIAQREKKSIHTIRTQIQRAIAKLGCSGRAEALHKLRQDRLLEQASND